MAKEVSGVTFHRVAAIEPERSPDGTVVEYDPLQEFSDISSERLGEYLNEYGRGPFCKFTAAESYKQGGVYLITVNNEVVYAGKCQSLAKRFGPQGYGSIQTANCLKGGQSTNCRVNYLILDSAKEGRKIELWFHKTSTPGPPESRILQDKLPAWNKNLAWDSLTQKVPGTHL